MNNVVFSQLSAPENWFSLVQRILPLLKNPMESGFQTSSELLSALAASRNLTPRALMKQVDAAKFLLEKYPDVLARLRIRGGIAKSNTSSKCSNWIEQLRTTLLKMCSMAESPWHK